MTTACLEGCKKLSILSRYQKIQCHYHVNQETAHIKYVFRDSAVWGLIRSGHKVLPERDEHHHFDTQEFAHWFDWTQFLPQSSVEQHQAVHGELD